MRARLAALLLGTCCLAAACKAKAPPTPSAPIAAKEELPATPPPASAVATPAEGDSRFHPECDAGDEAWVRRVVPVLLGRQPFGQREVQVLVDLVKQVGRRAVAMSLMRLPAFESRWTEFLLDTTRVERAGSKEQEACFGHPRPKPDAQLATFVRDHRPLSSASGGEFTMADLLASSMKLDDLTPFFRAQLFVELTRPLHYCFNLTPLENDVDRRRAFANAFQDVFLHRNIGCAKCHNADQSPTMTKKPETNRFWPTKGNFEKALWGDRTGRPPDEAFTFFRGLGVVARDYETPVGAPPVKEAMQPWGLAQSCGSFISPKSITDDPSGVKGFLGRDRGLRGTVWDMEQELHDGVDALRKGTAPFNTELESPVAFASLLSQSIVQDVWTEVYGSPLTLAHGFARNEAQRDLLITQTESFVASHWSLRALLANLVTHPLFAQRAPSANCASTYPLPAVFNPWAYDDPNAEKKANSSADGLSRLNARIMLKAVSTALDWPEPARFPSVQEAEFQLTVGARVDSTREGFSDPDFQGLLAWEHRFGTCQAPKKVKHDPPNPAVSIDQCVGRCDSMQNYAKEQYGEGCACDPACTVLGDCCPDYQASCAVEGPPAPPDWIDRLLKTAATWPQTHPGDRTTLRDLVAALRDRLWVEDSLDATDEALLKKFFGVSTLDVAVSELGDKAESRLRLYCGVLVKAPQFMLVGLPSSSAARPPKLVLPGETYRELCEQVAPSVGAETRQAVKCGDISLSVTPRG